MWLSTVDYYLGNHPNSLHDPDNDCYFWEVGFFHKPIQDALYLFVEKQANLLAKMWNHFCTQSVESLNASYGQMAPKKYNCNRIEGRIASAIIQRNSPLEAPFIIRECFGSYNLNEAASNVIAKDTENIQKRREALHCDEFRRKKNISRLKPRNKLKDDINGDYPTNDK